MIAVIAASSAKRRSVQILTYCRGRCIYTASRARHICMLRDNWPVIDWREPIGLQERLEGRSSHNGVISVMSRSRFQGTEVTIVTGAISTQVLQFHLSQKNISIVYQLCFQGFSCLHLHLVILQTLLSKATYAWGIHKAIHLEEANRQRKCP